MWEKSRSSPNKNSDRCSSWHTRLNRHTRTSNACFFKHTEGSSRTYPDKYSTSPSFSRGCFHSIAQDYTGLRPRHPFLDSLFGFVFTHYDWNTFYEVRRISYRRTVFLKVCLSVFVCVLHVRTKVFPVLNEFTIQRPKEDIEIRRKKPLPNVCVCAKAGKCTGHSMNKAFEMGWEDKLQWRYGDMHKLQRHGTGMGKQFAFLRYVINGRHLKPLLQTSSRMAEEKPGVDSRKIHAQSDPRLGTMKH